MNSTDTSTRSWVIPIKSINDTKKWFPAHYILHVHTSLPQTPDSVYTRRIGHQVSQFPDIKKAQ
jgi:hypothetical protein